MRIKIIFVTNKFDFDDIRPFLNLTLAEEVLQLNMYTRCTICKRSFANRFNLKRHMETVHVEQEDKENEGESNSESESDNETSKENKNDESSENSEESEDDDNKYTYGDVTAILRYTLKSNES